LSIGLAEGTVLSIGLAAGTRGVGAREAGAREAGAATEGTGVTVAEPPQAAARRPVTASRTVMRRSAYRFMNSSF